MNVTFPVTYDGGDSSMSPADPSDDTNEYPCLVRVTNGKEVNFSTRVSASVISR